MNYKPWKPPMTNKRTELLTEERRIIEGFDHQAVRGTKPKWERLMREWYDSHGYCNASCDPAACWPQVRDYIEARLALATKR